eukprot:tig00000093_g3664.t1
MDGGGAEADAVTRVLPRELLSAVFSQLNVSQRAVASRVCRRWRAAALEPPHSTELSLNVAGDVRDEDPRPALRVQLDELARLSRDSFAWQTLQAAVPDLERFAQAALSASAAAAVLRGPLCAGLARLELEVAFATRTLTGPASAGVDPALVCVDHVLAAAPPSLRRLHIAFPLERGDALMRSPPRVAAALQQHAPDLAHLSFSCFGGPAIVTPETPLPRLPRLEYMGALLYRPRAEALARLLPSLRRAYGIEVTDEPAALAGLAARGLACRFLCTPAPRGSVLDLRAGGAFEAAAALFRPGAVPPEAGPAVLRLQRCELPDEWPRGAFDGVETLEIRDSRLSPALLRWVRERAGTLRDVTLACTHEDVTPAEVLAVLEALRPGTRASFRVREDWSLEDIVEFLEAAAVSPRVNRAGVQILVRPNLLQEPGVLEALRRCPVATAS